MFLGAANVYFLQQFSLNSFNVFYLPKDLDLFFASDTNVYVVSMFKSIRIEKNINKYANKSNITVTANTRICLHRVNNYFIKRRVSYKKMCGYN